MDELFFFHMKPGDELCKPSYTPGRAYGPLCLCVAVGEGPCSGQGFAS